MQRSESEMSVQDELEPVISAMGLRVVDVTVQRLKASCKVAVVIYRRDGVTVDDCARVSRTVQPRLELILERDDVVLEVSSPGIDRVIKSPDEYTVFQGRGVQVLLEESGEWVGGVIEQCRNGTLYLLGSDNHDRIELADIRKARLDHTQEVG